MLVHNCHSGNFLRFAGDVERVFAEGVNSLNDSELDTKTRKEPDEKEIKQLKCAACGFVLPSGVSLCPACGHERPRRSMIETAPGRMVLINGSEKPAAGKYAFLGDPDAVWRQLAHYAIDRKKGDMDAAQRFAQAQYRSIYGKFAHAKLENTEPVAPSPELQKLVRSQLIRWANSRARRA